MPGIGRCEAATRAGLARVSPRPSDGLTTGSADASCVQRAALRRSVRAAVLVLAAVASASGAAAAHASQLLDRNARNVTLAVDAKGEALVTYTTGETVKHVLVWGAINARAPTESVPQVRFQVDYTGGWGKYHDASYWKHVVDVCQPYDGPALAYLVAACRAPDGSYWALQSWHVPWPDLGFVPWTAPLASTWLEISHWSGPVAKLTVYAGWVYREHYHRLFGKVTYAGKPVFGYSSSRYGVPLDGYGRLVYVDTLDAGAYGAGWHRENSFLTHAPSGIWCYGFYPRDPLKGGYSAPSGYDGGLRGPGIGSLYRVSVIGPGVTPDVSVTIKDPGSYEPSLQRLMRSRLLALGSDPSCDQH